MGGPEWQNSNARWRTAAIFENVENAITRLPMYRFGRNLGGHILSCSTMRLPWQRPLPSNGALNIQQLWASVGRMREPILFKFGLQQQIRRSTMTVTSSNIKILKIQNG